jgi:hypothetical protein
MAAARSCEDRRRAALKPICDGKSFFLETLRVLGAGSLSRGTVWIERGTRVRQTNFEKSGNVARKTSASPSPKTQGLV